MAARAAHLLIAVLAVAAVPVGAQPVTYAMDADRSWVHFEVLHFGTSTLRGRVGPLAGTVTLDAAAGRGEVGLAIDTAGVSTGVRPLDGWLRGPDAFASEVHARAFFVSRNFRFDAAGGVAAVRGEFTLRGVSQPLELRALRFGCRDGTEPGGRVCGGDFEGFVRRSDFGIDFGLPFVADRVRLLVQVQGSAAAPGR